MAAGTELIVVFNYRSPFCALIVDRLLELPTRYDVAVDWRIVREVPRPSSLPITESNPRFAYNREDCARRARWLGLPWQPPTWRLTDVVSASRVGQWLLATGSPLFGAYTLRVSRAYWCEGENVSDAVVIARIAREIGLDENDLRADAGRQAQIDSELDANARWCEQAGVLGAPFFIVDEERFWGSDRLGALERRLAEKGLGPAPVTSGEGMALAAGLPR